jgi:hypothetical protein
MVPKALPQTLLVPPTPSPCPGLAGIKRPVTALLAALAPLNGSLLRASVAEAWGVCLGWSGVQADYCFLNNLLYPQVNWDHE